MKFQSRLIRLSSFVLTSFKEFIGIIEFILFVIEDRFEKVSKPRYPSPYSFSILVFFPPIVQEDRMEDRTHSALSVSIDLLWLPLVTLDSLHDTRETCRHRRCLVSIGARLRSYLRPETKYFLFNIKKEFNQMKSF